MRLNKQINVENVKIIKRKRFYLKYKLKTQKILATLPTVKVRTLEENIISDESRFYLSNSDRQTSHQYILRGQSRANLQVISID